MSLIVLVILITALWISFGLPRILSKIERPTVNLEELEVKIKVEFEQRPPLPVTGPDFYDYYDEDGQVVRAERDSTMYTLIDQSLSRRR